jgi:transcriptional regulator GlxA family with amidase domain
MSMERRRVLKGGAALAAASVLPAAPEQAASRLVPPARGRISVAFVVSDDATVIDFTGPWEVFQDCPAEVRAPEDDGQPPFRLFTVAARADTVRVTGGMQVVPDFTVEDAPAPHVIVVPAHRSSPRLLDWIAKASASADLTMSVCTGAFALARAGLLKGRPATTHHLFLDRLAREFPDVEVRRGRRFVETGRIATAGGLTSGIDLALRVVERYFGRPAAQATADYMEYQGTGWRV